MERENADHSRRSPTTSVIAGREVGSCPQHLSVMFHNESVRPSSCVSSGRVGRSPFVIFKMMIEFVKSLNGYIPVKTLNGIQSSAESAILPPMLGVRKYKGRPLSQPSRKKKCPLLVWLCPLAQVPPARPRPQYIPLPSLRERSSVHEPPRQARNLSNGRCHCGR